MWRICVLALVLGACDSKGGSSSSSSSSGGGGGSSAAPKPSTVDKLKDGAKTVVDKADKVVDSLDTGEAADHLAHAKDSIAKSGDAPADCSWVRNAPKNDKVQATVDELRSLCAVDVPLAKATKAVERAEKAKQEQPGAPSYTECTAEGWDKAKKELGSSSDKRWVDLQDRWKKVCPSS